MLDKRPVVRIMKSNYSIQALYRFQLRWKRLLKDGQMSASGQLRLRIMISGYAIIIYSANNYLLIKTSVPSSAWCSCNFIISRPGHGRVWEIKVNASGAAGCEMLMLVGWTVAPRTRPQSRPPCGWSSALPLTARNRPGLWHDDTGPWWWLIVLFSSLV